MTKRIWELDAARGVFILGMVAVHLVYDLVSLYGLVQWDYSPAFLALMNWGGVLFLVLSGICVTLGSQCLRRGLLVFSCGMVCSAVTAGMYFLQMADKSVIIYFGVLHCLGLCMVLWPAFRRLPDWLNGLLGITMVVFGLYLWENMRFDAYWLIPLGIYPRGFQSADYFPLLPNLGFFLLGTAAGRRFYRKKMSLLPQVDAGRMPIRFLTAVGRLSLPIYLAHQPLIAGLVFLISLLR